MTASGLSTSERATYSTSDSAVIALLGLRRLRLLGQNAHAAEQPSDGVGRLGTLAQPLARLGLIDLDLDRISARVVVPEERPSRALRLSATTKR